MLVAIVARATRYLVETVELPGAQRTGRVPLRRRRRDCGRRLPRVGASEDRARRDRADGASRGDAHPGAMAACGVLPRLAARRVRPCHRARRHQRADRCLEPPVLVWPGRRSALPLPRSSSWFGGPSGLSPAGDVGARDVAGVVPGRLGDRHRLPPVRRSVRDGRRRARCRDLGRRPPLPGRAWSPRSRSPRRRSCSPSSNSNEQPAGIGLLEEPTGRRSGTLPRAWAQNIKPELANVTVYVDAHVPPGATIALTRDQSVYPFVYVGYPGDRPRDRLRGHARRCCGTARRLGAAAVHGPMRSRLGARPSVGWLGSVPNARKMRPANEGRQAHGSHAHDSDAGLQRVQQRSSARSTTPSGRSSPSTRASS